MFYLLTHTSDLILFTCCGGQVAGAAAAAGLSLADVAQQAKCASDWVGTMGVALSVCTLPGQVTSDRLGPGKMELGLGIVSYLFNLKFPHVIDFILNKILSIFIVWVNRI